MMNEITRLDIEIAIAKLTSLLAVLSDVRESNAVWKDMEMIGRVERIWKQVDDLQTELDNSL